MNRFLSSQPLVQDFGLGLVRIFIGAFLIYHGREVFDTVAMNKYLEWDMFKNSSGKTMVYAGKASEFISGILLVLGLFSGASGDRDPGLHQFFSRQWRNLDGCATPVFVRFVWSSFSVCRWRQTEFR
jgi:hypothetical protein